MDLLKTLTETAAGGVSAAKDYMNDETVTTRKHTAAICIFCILLGALVGFAFSPIKHGIYVNISNNGNYSDDEDDDWD